MAISKLKELLIISLTVFFIISTISCKSKTPKLIYCNEALDTSYPAYCKIKIDSLTFFDVSKNNIYVTNLNKEEIKKMFLNKKPEPRDSNFFDTRGELAYFFFEESKDLNYETISKMSNKQIIDIEWKTGNKAITYCTWWGNQQSFSFYD